MADDEDMGMRFMRKHMSEAQLSRAEGAFKNKSRPRNPPGTDGYIEQRYGGGDKALGMEPGANSGEPDRSRKGNKL